MFRHMLKQIADVWHSRNNSTMRLNVGLNILGMCGTQGTATCLKIVLTILGFVALNDQLKHMV